METEKQKANPNETQAVCSACQHDIPCGCPSGTEVERLRADNTNLRMLERVHSQLRRAQEKVIHGLELRIELVEKEG